MKPRSNAALKRYNTLALEARAEAFVEVADDAQLCAALAWARSRELPVVALGEGSNIVLAGDVPGLVVHLCSRGIEVLEKSADTVSLRVAAGENWHGLVRWSLERGYYGLENLALIPGTVGAAPVQNIGAYGVELQSVFLRLHALNIADGSATVLERDACEFDYRDSVFKHALKDRLVITAVDLRLSLSPRVNIDYPTLADWFAAHPRTEPTPEAVFDAVVDIRGSRLPDPAREPNAGSFFKNPVVTPDEMRALAERALGVSCYPQPDGRLKVPAAWFIDQCGWKGRRRNGVGVHDQHALVLVNCGSDSGAELLSLAADVARSVRDRFGVELEMEPRVYGGAP
jgi:UDP-N-acetylmuramate dehydrogenase